MGTIGKEKLEELQRRMKRLCIKEEDLIEKFVLGSGPGGQKVNKTASCVYLKHIPSGLEVKCGKERSRELNRFLARRQLCERLEKEQLGLKSLKDKQIEKIRKQKKRRKRRGESQDTII
ncbi:MAG: peptide chain release factor-like protein [Chlamydiales bacterium]|nr:peptide chain release factor-like protein [Chlamydiales bacterium]